MRASDTKLISVIIAFNVTSVIGNCLHSNLNRDTQDSVPNNNTKEKGDRENVHENFSGNISLSSTTHQNVIIPSTTTTPTAFNSTSTQALPQNENNISSTYYTRETNLCKCGVTSFGSGKIVGGTPVNEQSSWPWFATLVRVATPTKAHCGASLISPRYLLTAAHCLIPMIQAGLRNFKVKLGYNQLDKKRSVNETTSDELNDKFYDVPIESVTVHPQFEQSFPFHNDIGVVKLAYPINCTNRVKPICLPSPSRIVHNASDDSAITVGFGRASIHGSQANVLQQIRLKIVPNNECRSNYSQLPFKGPEILDSMICAWGRGKDSCIGDSGGPLFLWRKANMGQNDTSYFEQIGLISWGIGCASDKYPGIYSRLSHYMQWLKIVASDLTSSVEYHVSI